MKIDLIYVGKLASFQEGWHLVQVDSDVESILDLIGITRDHPDFDQVNDFLLAREDEISEGYIETVLSISMSIECIISMWANRVVTGRFGDKIVIGQLIISSLTGHHFKEGQDFWGFNISEVKEILVSSQDKLSIRIERTKNHDD